MKQVIDAVMVFLARQGVMAEIKTMYCPPNGERVIIVLRNVRVEDLGEKQDPTHGDPQKAGSPAQDDMANMEVEG